ncbi:MAG: hypothetical protein Q4C04_06735 [Clostridia bacterium]|nr:hypothetical protein [Clostridia bacterium]
MKKFVSGFLALVLALCLIPVAAIADTPDYYLAADQGYENSFTKDASGNLIFNLVLSDLGDLLISSLEFDIQWDNTKLELVGATTNPLTSRNALGSATSVNPEINVDAAMPATSEVYYAVASGMGSWFDESLNNVVLALQFQVKDGVADGEQIDIKFTKFAISLVDQAQTVIDLTASTVAGIDGYIIAGSAPVVGADKTALQALYNEKKALFDSAVMSSNPDTLANGTVYLSAADYAADSLALAAALAVLNDQNATQEQVDAAYTALNTNFKNPSTVVVDTTRLALAITYAQEFIASNDFDECSDALQKEWTDALTAALVIFNNTAHTQKQCDDMATSIYALDKTGEDLTVLVFAGITMLAVLALGFAVVRRRYN